MQVISLLRHAISQTVSEGVINCLIVTDSPEANIQLTRIHEHIFSSKSKSFVCRTAALFKHFRGRDCRSSMAETDVQCRRRVLLARHVALLPH